jgi:hypothetical protein
MAVTTIFKRQGKNAAATSWVRDRAAFQQGRGGHHVFELDGRLHRGY